MHTETLEVAHRSDQTVDPWSLLTGRSATIIVGFAVDLLRLGLHQMRPALATRAKPQRNAAHRWSRPQACGSCGAGSR